MADEDTTSADDTQAQDIQGSVSDEATSNAQLDESVDAKASEQTEASDESEESSQTSDTEDAGPDEAQAEADKSEDEDIKEWAAKKNLPLDDPVKMAKIIRDSEKEIGRKGQQTGQLKEAVDTANVSAGADDMASLQNQVAALSFYVTHPEAREHEAKMVEILEAKPWLAGDLETVLLAAKGSSTTDAERLVAERQAGKKEALETVARSERAAPPRASASTRDTSGPLTIDEVEKRLADGRMSQTDYDAWRQENSPFAHPA